MINMEETLKTKRGRKPKAAIVLTDYPARYNIGVHSKSGWVLPNRVDFGNWIDRTFKYKNIEYTKAATKAECSECENDTCPAIKLKTMSLFPHQQFIKDYVQFDTPYRGLLVFHGLGSGKTCSSIAAAEILLNHMEVVIMLPASLKNNYINEIKKCGSLFFYTKQHWTFTKDKAIIKSFEEKYNIDSKLAKKLEGLWIPNPNLDSNYNELDENKKAEIDYQYTYIIEKKYKLISYNGLKRDHIEKMAANGGNPFDNKVVIIDEVHNLISRIVNGRLIGSAIYKLLFTAKNCKLILLSGTPIINYPHEVAYLVNLISGPITYYELKANKNTEFDRGVIESILLENTHVDDFIIDSYTKKITIFLVPYGFHVADREQHKVKRLKEKREGDDIINEIVEAMNKRKLDISKRIGVKHTTLLPEKREEFDGLFINEGAVAVVNQRLFMKRILGTVSYYNSYSPDLYPSWSIEEVPVEMTTGQFNLYEKSRAEERKKETMSSRRSKGSDKGLFGNNGQVYRFFSRAICNFVFPEGIKRPFPSKLSDMKNEIDEDEEAAEEMAVEEKDKRARTEEYQRLLNQCLSELYANKEEYLSLDNIGKYSMKFKTILNNIFDSQGNVLVYSQFRRVEGLGVLGMALEAHGWREFKLSREGDSWVLPEEIIPGRMYMTFTGNNDESRLLLKIFNGEFDGLPKSIVEGLKGLDNLRGDIIKVIMITQSGSEGISLKNTRQVHIVEPYWNHIRLDQVIGRAVRTCSHVALPAEERNVKVFVYYSVLSNEQIKSSFTIRAKDKSMTSDEYLYDIAKRKKKIIDELLMMLKRASVDCMLNGKHHGLKCFAFPVNMSDNGIIHQIDINLEEGNASFERKLEQKQWNGQLLKTKKGNFVIKEGTNEVYDYDAYVESGKVVKVGVIEMKDGKRIIKWL